MTSFSEISENGVLSHHLKSLNIQTWIFGFKLPCFICTVSHFGQNMLFQVSVDCIIFCELVGLRWPWLHYTEIDFWISLSALKLSHSFLLQMTTNWRSAVNLFVFDKVSMWLLSKTTLQMHQLGDLPTVLITVSLHPLEKISGKVLLRLLLTKQGTWAAQV